MKHNMGEIIAERRKALGMTQKDLADKMNVTDKAVSKWERNLSIPDVASIPTLAEILELSVEELMGSCEEKEVSNELQNIINLILKVIPLAMGVALFVCSLMNMLDSNSACGMTGIALFCLALSNLKK